jgi:hypothetical protein
VTEPILGLVLLLIIMGAILFAVWMAYKIGVEQPNSIDERLMDIQKTGRKIMTTITQWTEKFSRIDAATTTIGQGIIVLLDRLRTGGLSDEEETQVLTDIEVRAAALEAIAASVENPVPVEPPPVP